MVNQHGVKYVHRRVKKIEIKFQKIEKNIQSLQLDLKKNNPERTKFISFKSNLKHYHGITLAEWNKMWIDQNGLCPICDEDLLPDESTHVDHCHYTNKNRSLLHSICNTGIGMFYDSPTLLRNAANYLENHKKLNVMIPKNGSYVRNKISKEWEIVDNTTDWSVIESIPIDSESLNKLMPNYRPQEMDPDPTNGHKIIYHCDDFRGIEIRQSVRSDGANCGYFFNGKQIQTVDEWENLYYEKTGEYLRLPFKSTH